MADNRRLKLKKTAKKFSSNSGSSDEVITIQDSPEKVSGIHDPKKTSTSTSIKSLVFNLSSDRNASADGFPSAAKSSVRLSTSVASATKLKVQDDFVKNEAKRIQSSLLSKALEKTNGYKPLPDCSQKVTQATEESYKKLPQLCKKCQSLSLPRGINWNFKALFSKAPVDTKCLGEATNQNILSVSEQITRDYNMDTNGEKTRKGHQKQQQKYSRKVNQQSDDLASFPASEMQNFTAASSSSHSFSKSISKEVVYEGTKRTSNENLKTDGMRKDKAVGEQNITKTEKCSKEMKTDDDYFDIDLADFDSEMDDFLLDIPDKNDTNCHKATLPSNNQSKTFSNDKGKEFPTHCIKNSKSITQNSNDFKKPGIAGSEAKNNLLGFKKSFQDKWIDKHSDVHSSGCNNCFKHKNDDKKGLGYDRTQEFRKLSQTTQIDEKVHKRHGLFRKELNVHSSGDSNRLKPKNDSKKDHRTDQAKRELSHRSLAFKSSTGSAKNTKSDFGTRNDTVVRGPSLKRKLDVVILDDAEEKSTTNNRSDIVPSSKHAKIQSTITKFHNPSNTSLFSCSSMDLAQRNSTKLPKTSKEAFSTFSHRKHNDLSNSTNFSSSMASNSSSASAKPTASALSPAKCPICQLKFPDWWKELQRNQHASKCLSDSVFMDDEDDELFGEIDLDC